MIKQSHKLIMAFAISFAMLLSLVVAIVCSAAFQKAPVALPEEGAATEPDSTTTAPPGEPESGLRFVSNGNGECVLAGIGSYSDTCLIIPEYTLTGERVTEIAAMAFYGCDRITSVQIPASVVKIGELAFSACKSLGYISVKPENQAYRDLDGVLYSADESTLILYPPARVGNAVEIQSVTTSISDMAFFDCRHLSHVSYTGTAEEWDQIRIGIRNHSLTAASKSFAGGIGNAINRPNPPDKFLSRPL